MSKFSSLIWLDMVLLEAKKTGVQLLNIRESRKVFKATSQPMPFRSPTEIPIFTVIFAFIDELLKQRSY